MKLLGLVLILGLTAAASVLGKTGGPSSNQRKGSWGLDAKSGAQEDDWIKKVGRKLGLTQKDMEVDFGPTDPTLEQNDAFQAAWKDFQASAQPSLAVFSKMNEKINKELAQATSKKSNKLARHLDDDKEEEPDKSLTESEDTPAEKDDEEKDKIEEEEEKADDEEEEEKEKTDEKDKGEKKVPELDVISRLKKRVEMINDKVDHLLFHNHHDLGGLTAHYTPYGVKMLPGYKGKDSIDQKLKVIDYMNNLGAGQNPMLHAILPYYLDENHGANQRASVGAARKLKRAW